MKNTIAYLLYTVCFLLCARAFAEDRCTYTYSVWNVKLKRSSRVVKVDKDYSKLTSKEKDATGCTPCAEDQEKVKFSTGHDILLCKKVAEKMKHALEAAIAKGLKIDTLVGYRSQMSRGEVDEKGDRTQLSNHSFGIAIDVNENHNGLYENCIKWSKACKLRKGGPYRPGEDDLSLTKTSDLVVEMEKMGFHWGGEIAGKQKDFMHFSPTGY